MQRAWVPVTTTAKTTLRSAPGTGKPKQGGTVAAGTQVVADRAQQHIQHRTVLQDVSWTRAVNVTAPAWTIGQAATVRYVRTAKLGADKNYPDTANRVVIPGRTAQTERRWSDQIGEYVWFGPSPRGGTTEIVRTSAGNRAFTPPATLVATNAAEDLFLDANLLETHLRTRLGTILTNAANTRGLNPAHLNKPAHVTDLLKPLNFAQAVAFTPAEFKNWYDWKEGVFGTITAGATYLVDSIDHWRRSLNPNPALVQVTDIDMSASDLHEEGLGVVFVDFAKPPGPPGTTFANKTNFRAVIKPEERGIEKSLFGTEAGSLASRLNRLATLQPNEAIAKIKMETHAQYGALIEFIQGTAARNLDRQQPTSPAMREAMVMAYIAGLSDVHRDNVIYINGKPHLIDADNALNNARVGLTEKPGAEAQSGFSQYSDVQEQTERNRIRTAPGTSTSKIMQALMNTAAPVPIVDAVRKTFTGKTGRVVPIATNSWAFPLRNIYPRYAVGNPGDAASTNSTRWGLVNHLAVNVPTGTPGTPQPGLEGETGTAAAGRVYNQAQEAAQIKSDYDDGKIPFFNYQYDTGHVLHNGVVVWHGEPLAEVLEKLLVRFPHQRNIFDV